MKQVFFSPSYTIALCKEVILYFFLYFKDQDIVFMHLELNLMLQNVRERKSASPGCFFFF